MKVYRITIAGQENGKCYIETAETLPNFISALEDLYLGEGYTIVADEMAKEDFDKLEEFTGF
jgi:hypothetical protein